MVPKIKNKVWKNSSENFWFSEKNLKRTKNSINPSVLLWKDLFENISDDCYVIKYLKDYVIMTKLYYVMHWLRNDDVIDDAINRIYRIIYKQ